MGTGTMIASLIEFFEGFPDEDACEGYLLKARHPSGWYCPRCGGVRHGRIRGRREFQCRDCGHQTSLTVGTMFQNSHLPLRKWFLAIYLATHDKRGISALALSKELSVTYRTAWYMLQRIRRAMAAEGGTDVLDVEVELDDAYIGASGGRRGRGTSKTPFIVAVERLQGGRAAMRVAEGINGNVYERFARDHVGYSAHIRADAASVIRAGLARWGGLECAPFDAHDPEASLPTVHHVISNFKAFIQGTFHGVGRKYLQDYMYEFSYRYGRRREAGIFEMLLKDMCASGHSTLWEVKNLPFEPLKKAA
jgi:transposase-like protein